MKIPLSPRLRACCSFISPGDRVADIGTDHGYLGIWLLCNGIASRIIASDIVPGPLSAAKRNAARFHCADKMEFYLSDGAASIPRDFDTLVCAGMGADTMISIIQAAPWLKHGNYRLILQCQTKTPVLRRFLSESGWHINRETLVRDGKFLYTVMEVIYKECIPLSPGQWYFPPALLEDHAPELPEYYRMIVGGLRLFVTGHGESTPPELVTALCELDNAPGLQWLKENKNDNS